MKTEYLLECCERPGTDDFFFIVSLKNKNVGVIIIGEKMFAKKL